MMKEYHDQLQKFPVDTKKYYDSLTDTQRVTLEAAKQEKKETKIKRKASKEMKKTGKPTKPISSFAMYVKEEHAKEKVKQPFGPVSSNFRLFFNRSSIFIQYISNSTSFQHSIIEMGKKWKTLSPEEKTSYTLKYQEAYKIYEKKLSEWEEEMVRQGKESLIRAKSRPTTTEASKKLAVVSKRAPTSSRSPRID